MFKKLRKISKTKWRDLSTGGKVAKVALRTAEIGLILISGLWILGIILFTIVVFTLMGAVTSGLAEGFIIGACNNESGYRRFW